MQYPTIGQPQYAFAPTGMAGGGLAALANQYRRGGKVRYFEEGGESGETGGADSSEQGGAGAAFGGSDPGPGPGSDPGGGADPGAAAQAAAQAVDNAVDFGIDVDAAEATLGAQVAAEAEQAEQDKAAETAAALGAQANAIAAEIAAQNEEDAKAATMAAAMKGQLEGFPGPAPAPGYDVSFQNPFSLSKPFFGIFDPAVTVTTPFMNQPIEMTPFSLAAPALGKGAQAVSAGIAAGKALGYAEGGLAAAQQTQSKGRGQDTMLVHMTPREVGGLQALAMSHGGSLTINPQTGLPEAGFLSRILPMLIGAGLSIASGGTLTPLMAAGITGAGYGVAKGSLKEGLMAGLGAYGGAGLTTALTAAGATTAGGMAANEAAKQAAGQSLADEAAKNAFLETGVSNATLPPVSTYAATATPAQIAAQQSASGNLAMAARGPEALLTEQGRSAFMKAAPTGSLLTAGTTAASALTPAPEPLKTSPTYIRPYSLDISNPSGTPQYDPSDTREREQVRYTYNPQPIYQAAQGGLAALNGQTFDDEYGRDEYKAGGQTKVKSRSLKGDPYYKFADSRRDTSMEASIEQNFAKGGLGAALPPRFLSGGGDGMSDSIKANIDGKQEARLADGEFVVPADVVSHLGNGSSKAGAKKLYAMMDKIRKARTGRERQAPEVNAQRYMPA